jgi:hypothetical protein
MMEDMYACKCDVSQTYEIRKSHVESGMNIKYVIAFFTHL